nr:hypothetical protein [Tanacetum cinerariifolium]
MRVHEDEILKTTFRMRYGRYEFTAMPFWVDQCTHDFHRRDKLGGTRVAFEDKSGAAEEREVLCEAQQGRSGVKRKPFGSCRNNMDACLDKESRKLVALGVRDEECDLYGSRASITHFNSDGLNIRIRGVKSRRVRDICRTMQAEIKEKMLVKLDSYGRRCKDFDYEGGTCDKLARLYVDEAVARYKVHVSSIPDRDRMYIEVLERNVEVVRNTSRYEACVRNLVVVGILTFCKAEIGESKMIGLELEQETTRVVVTKERIKEAKDRQES